MRPSPDRLAGDIRVRWRTDTRSRSDHALPIVEDGTYLPQRLDIGKGIAIDREQIGRCADVQGARVGDAEDLAGDPRRGRERILRLQPRAHEQLELKSVVPDPRRAAAEVGAGRDAHAGGARATDR